MERNAAFSRNRPIEGGAAPIWLPEKLNEKSASALPPARMDVSPKGNRVLMAMEPNSHEFTENQGPGEPHCSPQKSVIRIKQLGELVIFCGSFST